MRKLIISSAAHRDISEISKYTEATWGLEQKQRYKGMLFGRMKQLQSNPDIGISREEVGSGYRSLTVEQHHIFYRSADEAVVVLRVLHGSMDVHRHIGEQQDRAFESLTKPLKSKSKGKGRG